MLDARIILANDEDQRVWNWLKTQFTEDQIQNAISQLPGQRKSYLSNICKILQVTVPVEVKLGMSRKDFALLHLEKAKALLQKK